MNNEELLLKDRLVPVPTYGSKIDITWYLQIQLVKARPIIERQVRWEVGEELCCLVGNKMLEDMEAGKLLASQLEDYMNQHLKGGK